MEALQKERTVHRTLFTRAANELEKLIGTNPEDATTRSKFDMLVKRFENLQLIQEKYFSESLCVMSEDDIIKDTELSEEYEVRFNVLKSKFTDQERLCEDSLSVTSDKHGKRRFKLPQITLKQFSGEIKEFQPFWNQFRKVDEDEYIDESDKIQYLIQATVPNSPARRIVESFPAIDGNYSKIVSLLKDRFGREELQIEVYVRELLRLVVKNSSSKERFQIATLYDMIETQLRSLETLGVASENYSAILFPLVEGCLPEDLLRVWQRSTHNDTGSDKEQASQTKNRLNNLRAFLKGEVENEQRIALAAEGLGLAVQSTSKPQKAPVAQKVHTAAGLSNLELKCIFCFNSHDCLKCLKAQDMSYEKKKEAAAKSKACFKCLKPGHQAQRCRERVRCLICRKQHLTLMCPDLEDRQGSSNNQSKKVAESKNAAKEPDKGNNVSVDACNATNSFVFVRTVRVVVSGPNGSRTIRALIDSASQHSYISKDTALDLGLEELGTEKLVHALFGGVNTTVKQHKIYCVTVNSLNKLDKGYKFTVLDENTICSSVPPVFAGPWTAELHGLGIDICDKEPGPVELLFGADVCEDLDTGERRKLECGLTAIETLFGWTIIGRVGSSQLDYSLSALSISLLSVGRDISSLWDLEALGIRDPVESKTRAELAAEAEDFFLKTVRRDEEGRYVVRLPWLSNHPCLPDNFALASRRLDSCLNRLKKLELMSTYHQIFEEWKKEGIIEEVSSNAVSTGQLHYLPHRPVVKEGSTTPVRPVFDASAQDKGKPSLNDCLEKGTNLIEQIPGLLLRFRTRRIGVVADIRKAFLQISVDPIDCNALRFLWVNPDGSKCVYRHRRVVFGVNSSPFLLGSVIKFHLSGCLERLDRNWSQETVMTLLRSFYVDNCVTSMDNKEKALSFMVEAVAVLADGKFDLRGWEISEPDLFVEPISVLGLMWDCNDDVIYLNSKNFNHGEEQETSEPVITKRYILSAVARIFDPIGFSAPVTLLPKLLLQRAWEKQLGWDVPLDEDLRRSFEVWEKQLPDLFSIRIPRWIHGGNVNKQLHIFCDASGDAYATAIFLRVEDVDQVNVFLVAAKTRVAPRKGSAKKKPSKSISIPRLELLATLLGARLFNTIKDEFELQSTFFWSDSSTAIAWIRGFDEWSTFVGNRVREIRDLTPVDAWRHIPGRCNPADLPSRGCTPSQLRSSRWWEGPEWLRRDREDWPLAEVQSDQDEINMERKKRVACLVSLETVDWHLSYFSKFPKTVRMIAWCHRFVYNLSTKRRGLHRRKGPLTVDEVVTAERFIFGLIQSEAFRPEDDRLKALRPFVDSEGLIRVKTRLTEKEDTKDFKFPIVLPGRHHLVVKLIMFEHVTLSHAGTQTLLSKLRERFWLLGGRRSVRAVVKSCIVCKRFAARHFEVTAPPLPVDRICDARVFEITGVDFAGPMFLSSKQKAWICLFTCSVYRAVHFELTTSLSTSSFIQVLRRFIARRGRPRIIYSDNGTNFVGTDNALQKVDWTAIQEYSSVKRIQWRFNPPSAPWWGGFWERMVGVLKQLLRKVLGKACLDYEELLTVICDCESVVNSRPITYLSEEADLQPLTPAMFLQDIGEVEIPDCDVIDQTDITRRASYRNQLRLALRRRFRNEYLGSLRNFVGGRPTRPVALGEVVLVGSDDQRRMDWPLGRVMELIPGKDDEVRLARVKTARGLLLRPVRRLYPLEIVSVTVPSDQQCSAASKVISDQQCSAASKVISDQQCSATSKVISDQQCSAVSKVISDNSESDDESVNHNKFTRCGRMIRKPKRKDFKYFS